MRCLNLNFFLQSLSVVAAAAAAAAAAAVVASICIALLFILLCFRRQLLWRFKFSLLPMSRQFHLQLHLPIIISISSFSFIFSFWILFFFQSVGRDSVMLRRLIWGLTSCCYSAYSCSYTSSSSSSCFCFAFVFLFILFFFAVGLFCCAIFIFGASVLCAPKEAVYVCVYICIFLCVSECIFKLP